MDQGHDQGADGRSVDQGLTVQVLLEYLQVWDRQVFWNIYKFGIG